MGKGTVRGKGLVRDVPTISPMVHPTPARDGETDAPTIDTVAPTLSPTLCPEVVDEGDDGSLQRRALVALYEATAGCQWTYSDGWLSSTDECTWFGVHCFDFTVTSIRLRKFTLVDNLSIITV